MIEKFKHIYKSTTQDNGQGVNNRPDIVHPFYFLGLIVISLILLAFVGCKSTQPPTLPNTTHTDRDSIRTELRIDTIHRDRWHKEYQKGDTIFIHDSIDRWHAHYIYIHDSIDNSRIDTIYQTVEVEKKGSEFLQNSGIALWALIALVVIAAIIGVIVKFAK